MTNIIILLFKYLVVLDLKFLKYLKTNTIIIFCLIILSISL